MKPLPWGDLLFYAGIRLLKNRVGLALCLMSLLAQVLRIFKWSVPIIEVGWLCFYVAAFVSAGYVLVKYNEKAIL